MAEDKKVNMLIRNVPESLRRKFKAKVAAEAATADEDITINGKIIELIKTYVADKPTKTKK